MSDERHDATDDAWLTHVGHDNANWGTWQQPFLIFKVVVGADLCCLGSGMRVCKGNCQGGIHAGRAQNGQLFPLRALCLDKPFERFHGDEVMLDCEWRSRAD